MSNNIFIVIEGVDGSGKSTVAKKVSEKINGLMVKTPTGIWNKYRHLVENVHPTIRFIYYAMANHFACLHIRRELKKANVVCDRFWHSTKAHHMAYGCKVAYHLPLWILGNKSPDLVYYLSVSTSERERRVRNRLDNKAKDLDSKSLRKTHGIFLKLPHLIKINTTFLSEENVIDAIVNDIAKRIGRE
jgi:thymidylate kinase